MPFLLMCFLALSAQELSQPVSDDSTGKSFEAQSKTKTPEISKEIKPEVLYYLDDYARKTPENYAKDTKTLAEYLGRAAKSDLEKTRLIYSWIATHIHYNDAAFNSGVYGIQNSKNALRRRTAVCAGYSDLFYELATLMELKVEKISGYAKGFGHELGRAVTKVNHDWNSVKLNGSWRLIDVTWGASESQRTPKGGLKTIMKFDDYWFCTPPEQFIFTHLPEKNRWQLNEPKVTLAEYNKLPIVDERFFKMGFDPKKIFQSAVSSQSKDFVKMYAVKHPIQIVDAPVMYVLVRGKEYNFTFESEYYKYMVIVDDQLRTTFAKDKNIFSANYVPRGKALSIELRLHPGYFQTFLSYKIVDE